MALYHYGLFKIIDMRHIICLICLEPPENHLDQTITSVFMWGNDCLKLPVISC